MPSAAERKLAVVTGSAGGLGASFARKLAERGYDLWLIDRREEPLIELGTQLAARHGIDVRTLTVDLADDAAMISLAEELSDAPAVDLLVNNAGYSMVGYVLDLPVEDVFDMIRVHFLTAVRLTCEVLPGMVARDRGGVINVSSLSAWVPAAGVVGYAATKAAITSFTLGLYDELRDTNVRMQALCPGFIHTGFHDTEQMKRFDRRQVPRWMWMEADAVVECSLRCLAKRHAIVTPGWRNRVLGRLMRMPLFQPIACRLSRQKRARAEDADDGDSNLATEPPPVR